MTDFETHPVGTADLVKRLRSYQEFEQNRYGQIVCVESEIANEAADHIEQLVATVEQLEAELTRANAATAAAYEVAAREVECGCGAGPCQDTANCAAKDATDIRALSTPDQTAALDKLIAEAVKPYVALLERWQSLGCPNCSGDCSHANPPIYSCIVHETRKAILAASKKGGV